MCGIAGWVSYEGDLRAQRDVIATMTKTMALRGPDAGGVFVARHVGLGHRRLAIIDLAGGAQPMQAEEEGRTIASLIYTGEVYNFAELRDELKRLGHQFKTCSDTEVVLRGYLQWGDKVVERLNGMFAFAIWDVVTEELFLARDRMGVKPLFYYPRADGVLFGSEPKAILAHPSVRPRVNKDGFRELLVLAKNPEVTIYAGMCEVRPGEAVRVNRIGITKRCYWKLTAREHEDDLPRTIRTVLELLEDIVQRQIVADVPTGLRGPRRLRSHRSRAGQPGPRRPGSEPRRHPGKRLSAQSFRRHVLLAVPAVPGSPYRIDRGAVR